MLTEELKKKIFITPVDKFKKSLEGKTFSILGDSISTGGELRWNEATDYSNYYASVEGFKTEDCWWYYLISDLGMELKANNSWGGRCLTVINDFDVKGRKHQDGSNDGFGGCHIRELRALGSWSGKDGWSSGYLVDYPDYILIRLGVNDFNGGYTCELKEDGTYTDVHLQEAQLGYYDGTFPIDEMLPKDYFNINYRYTYAIREKTDSFLKVFSNAYAVTIARLHRMYPNSKIYCCTLSPFDANGERGKYPEMNDGTDYEGINMPHLKQSLVDFNDRIRQIAYGMGCGIIEHAQCGITYENFSETMFRESDGRYLHPNKLGCKLMGKEAVRALAFS